jgi:hypothetical protein
MNIGKTAVYEQEIASENDNCFSFKHDKYGMICITSRLDAYDNDTVWELKCTIRLNIEHMLQLTVYAWLWNKCMKDRFGNKKYKLLNIRTGQVMELNYNEQIVNEIIEFVFTNKYETKMKDNDAEFLAKCGEISEKYGESRRSVEFAPRRSQSSRIRLMANDVHG